VPNFTAVHGEIEMGRHHLSSALAGLLLIGSAFPAQAADNKKLIEFGWDIPTPQYIRKHAAAMQKVPFDGVVLDISLDRSQPHDSDNSLAFHVFRENVFTVDQFQKDINDLRTAKLDRLSDNFLRLNATPSTFDWFDDFQPVLNNARVAATVARQGGLKGIFFDAETYKFRIWCYPKQKHSHSKSFSEYERQVRARGAEFMRALNEGFPDLTLIVIPYTHRPAHSAVVRGRPLKSWTSEELQREAGEPVVENGLLPAFIDGMLSAASNGTTIVDGWEPAYGYRFAGQYRATRHAVKDVYRRYSVAPDEYDRHLRMGFGVWADFGARSYTDGWSATDVSKNYFTPDELEWSVRHALKHSDRYVWIYSERLDWWKNERVHPDYLNALKRARLPRDQALQPIRSALARDLGVNFFSNLSARNLSGASDQETFGDLWQQYRELATVPAEWKFHPDPQDEGIKQSWHAAEFDDSAWKTISIHDWWERAGFDYDGIGWYRAWIDVGDFKENERARLYFGAVDESAHVYVNGQLVGEHDMGWQGWDRRFSFDVSDALQPKKKNLIAVRVRDRGYGGGIWKSVKLVVKK
jgi:hypothetical protein